MNRKRPICIFIVIFFILIFGSILANLIPVTEHTSAVIPAAAIAGGILISWLFNKLMLKLIRFVKGENFTHLILILFCLSSGCICGGLLSIPVAALPGWPGKYGPIVITFLLFILYAILLSFRKEAFCEFINRITNGKIQLSEIAAEHEPTALLDTSVIIDGRIADIAHCGFVPGSLIVPNFILQELQFIADSEDAQRRQRGRRGLETLSNMQKDKAITISIVEFDIQNVREADAKLMHVAKELDCPILTNDYNLNKVAELQGIRILNVNDLTNAVKSILLPGEKLIVNVIQEGKEINQGVGYMEDGTMVVVENGRPYLGQQIDAVVTKILQTAAGRMIFARHEKELGVRR